MNKDQEIEGLRRQLAGLNEQLTVLNTNLADLQCVNQNQQEVIDQKSNDLNTAYFIVGTKQVLKDMKIVENDGGVLGLGKVPAINQNADKKDFKKIDITKMTDIPINKRKIKIISAHPKDSYKLDKDKGLIKDIKITKPDEFWSESKVLVAEVK